MDIRSMMRVGVLAGLAGGSAEVVWVAGYGAVTGFPAALVARGVTGALFPSLAEAPFAAVLGLVLHMILAVGLGLLVAAAFGTSLLRRIGAWPRSTLVVVTLGGVWAFNFLVLLPVLDPGFLTLLPVAVTLASKLLFGVAAATALRAQRV